MNLDILKEISQIAEELKESGETDLDTLKIGVLFPLIEQLGYDTTTVGDVQTAPLYTPDASYKMDYGLRGIDINDFKTVIKVIKSNQNPEDEFSKIRTCILQNNSIEYVIITDCFRYFIYANDIQNNTLVDVYKFNIDNFDTLNIDELAILENPVLQRQKQEYAEYSEPEEYEGPKNMQTIDENDNEKNDEKNKDKKQTKIKWGLIILAQIAVIILIVFLVLFLKNPDSHVLNIFKNSNPSELDYYSISATLNLSIDDSTQGLVIDFDSKDIPQGGVIHFDVVNGDDSAVVYGVVDSNGKLEGSYTIPSNWKSPSIVVTAYLNFDEVNHQQPQNVKDKFGELGDKIVAQEGAPSKSALVYSTIDYDSEAVQEYLAWLKEQEEANKAAERLADFAKFNVRYDSLGNIKVIPNGYDMNSVNITGNIHVYPQIFYDAKTGFAHFYLVAGQISSVTWSMFRSVSFYADGTAWAYEIGNNEKKQQVNGQYITEWIYYDNSNISTLTSESALLGTSSVSQVAFNGSKVNTYTLSDVEKSNISEMLALYNKYFSDSSNPPTTDWFESDSDSNTSNSNTNENNYSLNYIYTPSSIVERDGSDQKELNSLSDAIDIAGSKASKSQLSTYDINSHKYRELSDGFKTSLINYLKDAKAMLVYEQDYESSDTGYYKVFFNYENPRSIEDGYIPYIYIMENKTVYIPVKTSTGGTISEKSYASCVLSQTLYDQLINEIKTSPYKQIN